MDGGRGGGRGKGKKSKAAKKKAAAAASQPMNQKKATSAHGAKKVSASHSIVQVVAVSKAPESAPSTAPHDQTMTKSKRKRLKKAAGAANALLKKQAAADASKAAPTPVQQAKKSVPVKSKVAVLTPPAAKSHVVTLTSGNKKKKKQSTSESGETVPMEQLSEGTKTLKTMAVLRSSLASAKTKPVVATTTSPKRRRAQMQKSESVTTSDASGKAVNTAKVKAKPTIKSAGIASTVASSREIQVQVPVKSDVQSSESVTTASAKITEPETTTQKNDMHQVDNTTTASAADPSLHATKVVTNEKHDASKVNLVAVPPKKIAPKKKLTTCIATAPTAANCEDNPSCPPASNAAVATRGSLVNAAYVAPANLTVSSVANDKTTSQEPAPSVAASTTSAMLHASGATASSPNRTAAKLSTSRLVDTNASNDTMLPSGGIKRQRSIDQVTTSVDAHSFQPPAKRNAVANEGTVIQPKAAQLTRSNSPQLSADTHASTPGQPTSSQSQVQDIVHSVKRSRPGETPIDEIHETNMIVAVPSVKVIPLASKSAARGNGELGKQNQSTVKKLMKLTSEHKIPPVPAQITSAEFTHSKTKTPKPTVTTETGIKIGEVGRHFTPSESESAAKTQKLDMMDSHAYVQKMMMNNHDTSKHSSSNHIEPTAVLPPRPLNAWGASFGMVPPVKEASSTLRTLAGTPLSSWFLSKGCANFVKQVNFSDDDDENSSYDGNNELTRSLMTSYSFDKIPPKRRVPIAKKNAFLESLTTQSNWRTWYGNVDLHNLLDPPLPSVPEKLRTHEVTPLALPEPAIGNGSIMSTKKTGELEMLEADIRREKQRGSVFSDHLLMMLQGKTVSGKFLEEEYSPLLSEAPNTHNLVIPNHEATQSEM